MKTVGTIIHHLLVVVLLAGSTTAMAQNSDKAPDGDFDANSDAKERVEMLDRVQLFMDDLRELQYNTESLPSEHLGSLNRPIARDIAMRLIDIRRSLKSMEFQWNTYYQVIQPVVAEDEELMNLCTDYISQKQRLEQQIERRLARMRLMRSFLDAESFIPAQKKSFDKWYKKAMQLSMVKKMAPRLEKVKGAAQLKFNDVQLKYEKAKAASDTIADLRKRMLALDKKYVDLKNTADKIQACEYKPLFQRIKDYLMGLAAVAIVLMFFHMMVSRLQALKKTRDSMKKLKEMTKNGGTTYYPTI